MTEALHCILECGGDVSVTVHNIFRINHIFLDITLGHDDEMVRFW